MHQTQCDPKLDYFRSSPSTEKKAAGLLAIHKHKFRRAARPFFGLFCSVACDSCVSCQHALPPLSTWNKPNSSFSSDSSSVPIATRPVTASHLACGKASSNALVAQAIFPLIVPTPTGAPGFRVPPGKNPLKVARNFADQMLLYAYACRELTDGQKKGKMLHETMHWMTTMQFMLKGMQEAWLTLPGRHKLVMEASVIGWQRGVYGLPDANAYTPEEVYLVG